MGTVAPGAISAVGGGGSSGNIPAVAAWSALPGSPTLGDLRFVPRLCGNGYFMVMWNGSRWSVVVGQSVIRDPGPSSAGYDLTASGTSYVVLSSYTIPAGMVGDGEDWRVVAMSRNNGVYTAGNDGLQVRLSTNNLLGTTSASVGTAGASKVARGIGAFTRLSGVVVKRTLTGDVYTNQSADDVSVDLSVAQTIDAGISPGAIGNTMRLRFWSLVRAA